jgi:hypothetical protein
MKRNVYMVRVNKLSGCVFVKTIDFFRDQGGFEQEWGLDWAPFVATSFEHARELGCQQPWARPYTMQPHGAAGEAHLEVMRKEGRL